MTKQFFVIAVETDDPENLNARQVGDILLDRVEGGHGHSWEVTVEEATEEFGQNFRGLTGEPLPVGKTRPSRTREHFVRLTGPWHPIREGSWYGYNGYEG